MGDFGYSASVEEVDYIIGEVKATPIPADCIDKTFRSGCIGGLSPAPCPPSPPGTLSSPSGEWATQRSSTTRLGKEDD